MGRRNVPVDDEAGWVFNRLANVYRCRPSYPAALVERLVQLGGGPGAKVVDLGAGTGHLALPLARAGLWVTAVEPARRMLDVLAANTDSRLAARCLPVHATAETTGLASRSFDLALLADALHWVDPERAGVEIARLVAPGGRLAVVTIELASTPFIDEVLAAARAANPRAFPKQRVPGARCGHLFAAANTHRRARELFAERTLLPAATIAGFLSSLSFVGPALAPDALATLVARTHAAADRHGGALLARRFVLEHATVD